MKPFKIVVVDDEPGVLALFHSFLSELDGIQLVGTAINASDTLKLVKEQKPDLVLLDIELPDVRGIELVEKLRNEKPDIYIVFVTAHREYSLEAFRLYVYDYILKPIDKERVKATIHRIQRAVQISEKNLSKITSHPQINRMCINLGNERVILKFDEIYYLEKHGRNTLIHCTNGKYIIRETLHDLQQRLGGGFFRSHKSYIINIDEVERVINLPGSSYYEVMFKNYSGRALLSRDRVNTLMALFEL